MSKEPLPTSSTPSPELPPVPAEAKHVRRARVRRRRPVEVPLPASVAPPFNVVIALSLFSFFVTCYFFLKNGSLYWDNARHFNQFRDNLHALATHGEIAWWFPHVQGGWPSYYYSTLGFPHGVAPLFVLLGAACWLVGRLVTIQHYLPLYIVYFGLLTPMLLLFAVRAFSVHFLKTRQAALYALVVAAFSPGVMLNVSNVGFLEHAAYGLFFGAALLRFLSDPGRRSLLLFALSLVPLGLTFNFAYLVWNAVAVPLFIAVVLGFAGRRRTALLARIRSLGWKGALGLAAVFVVAALPNLIVYAQGQGDLERPALGDPSYAGASYPFKEVNPGNPLMAVAASLPGFGEAWGPYRANRALKPSERNEHIGYIYQGLLCIPLTIIGLLFGRLPLRWKFLSMLLLFFAIVSLGGYSPLFALVLTLPTPLQSNSHYADLLQRSGGYLVLIAGSAFGLDTLLRGRTAVRRVAFRLFVVITLVGLVLFALMSGRVPLARAGYGFSVLVAMLMAVLLHRLALADYRRSTRLCVATLIALALVDVSTHAFLHVRRVIERSQFNYALDDTNHPSGVGTADPHGEAFANDVVVLRTAVRLCRAGLDEHRSRELQLCDKPPATRSMPRNRIVTAAHLEGDPLSERARLDAADHDGPNDLAIAAEHASHPEIQGFLGALPERNVGSVEDVSLTYNDRVLRVDSRRPGLLLVVDAYHKYWRAEVNGRAAPVARAMIHYKAVPVPAGRSEVRLRFSPPWVGASLLGAYGLLLGLGVACVRQWRSGAP